MVDIGNLVDTHCHPTDRGAGSLSERTASMHAVCAMSTHIEDQDKVEELHKLHPDVVRPYYGFHPWWSHLFTFREGVGKREHYEALFLDGKKEDLKRQQLYGLLDALPSPIPFQSLLDDVERRLQGNSRAQVGEVGIDKVFRIKGVNGRLTLLQTSIEHQKRVAVEQVRLAKKYDRVVSMHSVSATQGSMDIIRDAGYQKAVLHSCGMGHNAITYCLQQFPGVHFGFSTAINSRSMKALEDSIAVTRLDRILSESDLPVESEYAKAVESIVEIIARVKNKSNGAIVDQIKTNFDKLL